MADFKKALKRTLQFEGVFSQDELDLGGDTYCGISRIHWPNWAGWSGIDEHLKAGGTLNVPLSELEESVAEFYRDRFWDPLKMPLGATDEWAWYLFDTAVNMGITVADNLRHMTVSDMRLARITRYVELTDKNRSLVKFLRGWIKRALARLEG